MNTSTKAHLASVLNGMEERWDNGKAVVHYSIGQWTWFTPTGCGTSDDWTDALIAVADHLA